MSIPPGPISLETAQGLLGDLMQRAATDLTFRDLCVTDGRAAVRESMGLDMPEGVAIVFVTDTAHGPGMLLPPYVGPDEGPAVPAAVHSSGQTAELPPSVPPPSRGLNIKARPPEST